MYTISKQFHFSASHQLNNLSAGHPCSRLHGHNYAIDCILQSDCIDERGFVVDYNDLSAFSEMLAGEFDHKHLNDVLPCQPSAENIAKWLYDWAKMRWPQVVEIRVSETPKTWAAYRQTLKENI